MEREEELMVLLNTLQKSEIILDLTHVESIDISGAWFIQNISNKITQKHTSCIIAGVKNSFQNIFDEINRHQNIKIPSPPKINRVVNFLNQIGKKTIVILEDSKSLLNYLGIVGEAIVNIVRRPLKFRLTSAIHHMKQTGFDAIPIVGLLTFLIGVVMAYQGATQLKKVGADIYTINLVGLMTLREFGILLVAIITAGRSGSSFTAQIGTMSVNEEVDAMRTMGLNPTEVLVVPRIVALLITLPLLTFFANLMSLIGGGFGCYFLLDISIEEYISTLQNVVPINALWVGLSKAPVFAFGIAVIGCYEGFKVSGSAESVGIHTTKSVVKSLFMIMILDALFSIFFTYMDI
jgi:phospholipid/cholesterol/gamma-HCH transport system permease protein